MQSSLSPVPSLTEPQMRGITSEHCVLRTITMTGRYEELNWTARVASRAADEGKIVRRFFRAC